MLCPINGKGIVLAENYEVNVRMVGRVTFPQNFYHSHENYYFYSWMNLLQREFCIESETLQVTGKYRKGSRKQLSPHSSLTSSQLLPKPHFPLIPVPEWAGHLIPGPANLQAGRQVSRYQSSYSSLSGTWASQFAGRAGRSAATSLASRLSKPRPTVASQTGNLIRWLSQQVTGM
jgi:hypothetical protein